MSFKIFTLQFFGKIKPVEEIEKRRETLINDYKEFLKIEKSDELKLYQSLEKEINSSDFKKFKADTEALKFKGSSEYVQLKEFGSLQKKKSINAYLSVLQSGNIEKFEKLKASQKIAEYNELKKYVYGGAFEKEKKEIKGQVFKGSAEASQLRELKKLEHRKGIRIYNALHNTTELKNLETKPKSKKLRLYRETLNSVQLKRCVELKNIVNSESFKQRVSFLQDKTKFERSDAHKKELKFKHLQSDQDIQFVLKFEKSQLYKNYLKVHGSPEIKRYTELKELTGSKRFADRKAYLEDKKKWEKTDEFKRQQQYLAMKKLTHLVKYFNYLGKPDFDFLKEWDLSFEETFTDKQLNVEKWSTTPYLAEKMLGDNFAVAGDLSVFTKGKNVKTNGKLTIEVRKEKVNCKVWQMPAGMVPSTLEYTSGMVTTWNSFGQEDGIFEAKIKFAPHRQIVSSVYLSGNEGTPRVNLIEMGAKDRIGFLHRTQNGKALANGLGVGNLKHAKWYIFTIEKKRNNFIWKINDTEILKSSSGDFDQKLSLNISSIVIREILSSQLPALFEIEWVKCWKKK